WQLRSDLSAEISWASSHRIGERRWRLTTTIHEYPVRFPRNPARLPTSDDVKIVNQMMTIFTCRKSVVRATSLSA
ncbi:MAG TPA: hypothetical protein PLF25_10775, partial [Accumulibacter sp.]|nr:hypothetical protein [Accumulibacter sp.]